jgi:ubiquinone/menaquinone biosynthesis C-methylase UbiE
MPNPVQSEVPAAPGPGLAALCRADASAAGAIGGVPEYLSAYYWWAYVHPNAVRIFERDWLVNLILWGNYAKLRDTALAALGDLQGHTLQVACVYGDLTCRLARRASALGGRIDVVDVLPVQLSNLRRKLPRNAPVRLLWMDAADLALADASYDRALLFFLLHEQPPRYRRKTLAQVFRVVKPGGTIVIVDYARPRWWNPLCYLWSPVLAALEPFALDLWREEIAAWLPEGVPPGRMRRRTLFGGLYQELVITR